MSQIQDAFEEEFMRYGVDMTWHGHHHTYQRSCPLYKGRCVPPNPGENPYFVRIFPG